MSRKSILLFKLLLVIILSSTWPATGAENSWQDYPGCTVDNQILELKNPFISSYEVFELEERLEELGYHPGKVDGVFDQETEKAVKIFQRETGLPTNGQVTAEVWQYLARETNKPVTSRVPPPAGLVTIEINLDKNTLTVYSDNSIYKEYPVAIGKGETPSPVGEWRIVQKSLNWGGGFGTRWLGLNVPWGIYGIHGTNKPWSVGREASHGCFRMFNQDVEEIFPWVKYGTPVKVVGEMKYFPWSKTRSIKLGHTGIDVVALQLKLKEEG
ncbi:MAG: L,D-transpeptidase family protein, partial [Bacillota bacterium]